MLVRKKVFLTSKVVEINFLQTMIKFRSLTKLEECYLKQQFILYKSYRLFIKNLQNKLRVHDTLLRP